MRVRISNITKKLALPAVALWLLSSVALAAENEVRLPVEKTTRMTPAGELSNEPGEPQGKKPDGKKAAAKKPEAKTPEAKTPEAATSAKPIPAKPEKAPAAAALKKQPKPEGPAPETAEAPAAKPEKPAPKPAPAPKPKPEPRIDPKALELPPAQAGPRTTTPLPASGQWVGDVDVEFQADRVVLHVATTGEVERVTWFNLIDPKEPRKLAMDLRGTWHKKGGPVVRFETGPVVSVVTGEHPDRLRLSMEFRDGAVKPDVAPVVEKGPHGLTLTIPLAVRLK